MVETKEKRRAHFDDTELNEYDKTRGQKMKIDDPKTPYHDDVDDEEMTNEAVNEPEDPVIEGHLTHAKKNRDLNA